MVLKVSLYPVVTEGIAAQQMSPVEREVGRSDLQSYLRVPSAEYGRYIYENKRAYQESTTMPMNRYLLFECMRSLG